MVIMILVYIRANTNILYNHQGELMSFSSHIDPSPSTCNLDLYHADKRVSDTEWCDTSKVSFSKQTAKKANDVISAYFGVDQEWDKKLLKCIFLDDPNFNWFEFARADNDNITLGVKISGDRNVVFNENPEEFYVPAERQGKLAVTVKSVFGNNDYELDYEKIKTERNEDYSIVALFNSNSFIRVSECSTNLGFSRTLEKIDAKEKKAKICSL